MTNKITVLFLVTALTHIISVSYIYAQISGNHAYRNQNNQYADNSKQPTETTSMYSTDSTLVITAKVLLNKKADYYVLTVGVSQSGKTVIEANKKLNTRVQNITQKLKKLDIASKDIYIDFVAEIKLYDKKIHDNKIIEFFDGFSIKKNVIIKVDQLSQIDNIIDSLSEEQIYDIVKVEYINQDIEQTNKQLFNEALAIIHEKKKLFENNSSIGLSGKYRISHENLKTFYPKNLYDQYTEAHETSEVTSSYSGNYINQEIRKEKTFYYNGVETELGIDKVIDTITPTIGIQYVIEIQMIYELAKKK